MKNELIADPDFLFAIFPLILLFSPFVAVYAYVQRMIDFLQGEKNENQQNKTN